jgi:hypothetical protein
MKYQTRALLAAALLLWVAAPSALAQCDPNNVKPVSDFEKNSLVIDVRPDQINQFRGKSAFDDKVRVVLVNMNPFLFSYKLKVDQTEIQDTGFLNFLKLLGAPVTDLIGSVQFASHSSRLGISSGGNLSFLIRRTEGAPRLIPNENCSADDKETAEQAAAEIRQLRAALLSNILIAEDKNERAREIKSKEQERKSPTGTQLTDDSRTLTEKIEDLAGRYTTARNLFDDHKDVIFNSSVEAKELCSSANTLHTGLSGYPSVAEVKQLKKEVADFKSLVKELRSSARDYAAEYESCPTRIGGLNYANNILRLADELDALGIAYEAAVNTMSDETKGYNALRDTIAKLETDVKDAAGNSKKENRTLQREYVVNSRYDISALDVTVTAVPLGADSGLPVNKDLNDPRFNVVGDTQAARQGTAEGSARIVNVGDTNVAGNANGVRVFAPHGARIRAQAEGSGGEGNGEGGGNGGNGGGGNGGGARETKVSTTSGARQFEISAGMAFSSLDRREYQAVLGYARNEQGEIIDPETGQPTTERKLTKIVGLSEGSSRRFAPMGMLHYRFPYSRNLFASVGFTGKRDDYGVDLEYLIGPSFLYRNMFFTLGGYAGKQQKLAGDLFEGAQVEGDIPVRKQYKWGLGFSFTYKIPLGGKKETDN